MRSKYIYIQKRKKSGTKEIMLDESHKWKKSTTKSGTFNNPQSTRKSNEMRSSKKKKWDKINNVGPKKMWDVQEAKEIPDKMWDVQQSTRGIR
jgi:hypothetical protein